MKDKVDINLKMLCWKLFLKFGKEGWVVEYDFSIMELFGEMKSLEIKSKKLFSQKFLLLLKP